MDEFGIGFKGHTLYIDARGSVCARNGADFDYRLADRLAQAGYFVVIPNLAEGDAGKVPLEVDPELASWSRTHIDDGVYPGIKIILKAMRTALGVEKIGAMGFSDSARSVVRFLAEGKGVDAGFIVMPSFATILPTEVAAIARPLSIADSGMELQPESPIMPQHSH